jgi:hopanoid-associated phosphorylase
MFTLATVLCASGLAAEGRAARAAGFDVIVGGGDPDRTEALVSAAARRAQCLVSFGIAGGLAPHLRSGDIVLSTEVIDAATRWRPSDDFSRRMTQVATRIGAICGPVLGAQSVVSTQADKARTWSDTGALAVDLESAAVARAAAAAGIPFLVLRAIADPANRQLPPAALIPLADDGTPAIRQVLAEILRRPRQLGALLGVARETRRALVALAGAARVLGGEFSAPAPVPGLAGAGLAGIEPAHGVFDMPGKDILSRPLPV